MCAGRYKRSQQKRDFNSDHIRISVELYCQCYIGIFPAYIHIVLECVYVWVAIVWQGNRWNKGGKDEIYDDE